MCKIILIFYSVLSMTLDSKWTIKKKKKVRNAPLPFGILSSIRVNKAYSEAKEKTVILGQEIQCKAVASNKRVKNLERSGFASVSGVWLEKYFPSTLVSPSAKERTYPREVLLGLSKKIYVKCFYVIASSQCIYFLTVQGMVDAGNKTDTVQAFMQLTF